GSVIYRGRDGKETDVVRLERSALRRWRWREAAMVFQGAMNSFNPVLRLVEQIADTIRAHADERRRSKGEFIARRSELRRAVRLEPNRVLSSYPHELSGGMRQRVLIAMSLLLEPRLLVLDEPTTALDILTQRSIVDVLAELRERHRFAMIFISHDLGVAAELADRDATMYAGRVIETGTSHDIFDSPRHPYTSGLINAVPPVVCDLPELASNVGTQPSLSSLPTGCAFHPRCSYAVEQCSTIDPDLEDVAVRDRGLDHRAACIRWQDVKHERKVIARA